ncbi:MAG: VIT1/CCC1 transporter family protein [Gammaproteobacteria bacterium]|nr:VIT1/CCC1 transporter family protein [Gammaproteobacteria bacterium]MDH5262397.1 VIT1/CCC1 transporter family protein [Gammaproteobacteria bacterium]MDH5622402.1 VIT1/CCC1 transporter family protein [Gammaproteobacteria bacterium]
MFSKTFFFARYLDPLEQLSEFLFGLIMVLSFTLGAGLIVGEGSEATKQMLLGVIGCNIAWGLIDGAIYVINRLCDRSSKARLLDSIRLAGNDPEALSMVGNALDSRLEPITTAEARSHLYAAILDKLRDSPSVKTELTRDDLIGALACFVLVFLSAVPAVLPFLLVDDPYIALRTSNFLLLSLLFLVGWKWARTAHSPRPWVIGLAFLLAGLTMVGIAILFGG